MQQQRSAQLLFDQNADKQTEIDSQGISNEHFLLLGMQELMTDVIYAERSYPPLITSPYQILRALRLRGCLHKPG